MSVMAITTRTKPAAERAADYLEAIEAACARILAEARAAAAEVNARGEAGPLPELHDRAEALRGMVWS